MTISKLDQECERAHAEHRAAHSRLFSPSAILSVAGYPQHMIDKEREREAATDPYERYRHHKAGVLAAVRALIADDVTLDGEGELPDAAVWIATQFLLQRLDRGDAAELVNETTIDVAAELAKVPVEDADAALRFVNTLRAAAMEYARSAYLDDIVAEIRGAGHDDTGNREDDAYDEARQREVDAMRASVPNLLSERL